jgi:UDP-glucose 4-epimerase
MSGRLGECHDPETHLIPLVVRAALSGKPLSVYGVNYETRDGSCVRDYIHVSDLAEAHLLGLKKLLLEAPKGTSTYNLGTERGSTVLEVIEAMNVITGKSVLTEIKPGRAGDSAILIADSAHARGALGWKPTRSSMHDILKSTLAWEKKQHASGN